MFPPKLHNKLYIVTCVLYNIKISFYNQFSICISIRSTPCNWIVDIEMIPYLHFFHIFFAKKTLIFSMYFLQLIVLILRKIIILFDMNNFSNDGHICSSLFDEQTMFVHHAFFWHLCYTHYVYAVLSK